MTCPCFSPVSCTLHQPNHRTSDVRGRMTKNTSKTKQTDIPRTSQSCRGDLHLCLDWKKCFEFMNMHVTSEHMPRPVSDPCPMWQVQNFYYTCRCRCVTVLRRVAEAWQRSGSCWQAGWREEGTVLRALTRWPVGKWGEELEQGRNALVTHGERSMRSSAASLSYCWNWFLISFFF